MIPSSNIVSPFSVVKEFRSGDPYIFKLNQDHRGFVDETYDEVQFEYYWSGYPQNPFATFLVFRATFKFGVFIPTPNPNFSPESASYNTETNEFTMNFGSKLPEFEDPNIGFWVRVQLIKEGSSSLETEYPFFYAGGFTFPSVIDEDENGKPFPENIAHQLTPGSYEMRLPIFVEGSIDGDAGFGTSANTWCVNADAEQGFDRSPVAGQQCIVIGGILGDNTVTTQTVTNPGGEPECGSFLTTGIESTRLESKGWEWSIPVECSYTKHANGDTFKEHFDLDPNSLVRRSTLPRYTANVFPINSGFDPFSDAPSASNLFCDNGLLNGNPNSSHNSDPDTGWWTNYALIGKGYLASASGDYTIPAASGDYIVETDGGVGVYEHTVNDTVNRTMFIDISATCPTAMQYWRTRVGDDDHLVNMTMTYFPLTPHGVVAAVKFIGP